MKSLMVVGADTGVGKTVVCAAMLKAVHGTAKAAYWKPVQTGTMVGNDSDEVRELTSISDKALCIEPVYKYPEPMAPFLAAEKWGKPISIDEIVKQYERITGEGYSVIMEGAGGIFAPLTPKELQIDLIDRLKVPILIVGDDKTGVVNQVLLTLHVARARKIPVLGVVLLNARGTFGNARAINLFGEGTKVLAEIPPIQDKRTLVAELGGHDAIRSVLGLTKLPK